MISLTDCLPILLIMFDASIALPLNTDYILYRTSFFKWRYKLVLYLLSSILGCTIGYYIGKNIDVATSIKHVFTFLFNINMDTAVDTAVRQFNSHNFMFIFLKPLIPAIPFALINNLAGSGNMNFLLFLLYSSISRIFKFFIFSLQNSFFSIPIVKRIFQTVATVMIINMAIKIVDRVIFYFLKC